MRLHVIACPYVYARMKRPGPQIRRKMAAILLLAIAAVCACALYNADRPALLRDTQTASPDSASPGTAPELPDGIEVFFAPDSNEAGHRIGGAFLTLLHSAQESIDGAFYEFQLTPAADALIERHRQGVKVRLVSDSDYEDRTAIQACIDAGIPVVFDGRTAFMHDKFCVVDGAVVWTGSTNITENCFYRNNNNALQIRSEPLAVDFENEFEEMFANRRFGARSPRKTTYPPLTVGTAKIECYFAPEDDAGRAIVSQVDAAHTSIDFMVFTFTSKPIAEAMAKRCAAGVRVRGLFEERNMNSASSKDEFLREKGAEVYADRNPRAMHDKVMIIDRETVVTGSYNFTKSAEAENDENALIVHSPALAETYTREFESLCDPKNAPNAGNLSTRGS